MRMLQKQDTNFLRLTLWERQIEIDMFISTKTHNIFTAIYNKTKQIRLGKKHNIDNTSNTVTVNVI